MKQSGDRDAFDVIISGGSFAGLALARALRVAFGDDIDIAVLDRKPLAATGTAVDARAFGTAVDARAFGTTVDVRAFALSAASKRMLDVLGVWKHVDCEAQPVTGIDITDSGLEAGIRPVLLSYENKLAGDEPASMIVPASALSKALADIVASDDAITVIAPAEAERFVAGPTHVELMLKCGRTLVARLLVAAEGRKSPLRDMAGIKLVGWPFGQTGIVTTVAHERPHGGRAVQHFLPGGPFAILPLPGNRSCITWSETREEAHRILTLPDEAFLSGVDKRFGGKLGALTLAGPRQSWPLEMHLARRYVADRFAIIGDAAHIVHPIAGQGLNLALRDVAALTEVVADSARVGLDIANGEALDRYERWRRFDSWLSASAFDGLNRLFSNDVTLLRSAREFGLGVVDRLPGLKQMFVAEAAGLSGEVPRLLRGEPV